MRALFNLGIVLLLTGGTGQINEEPKHDVFESIDILEAGELIHY